MKCQNCGAFNNSKVIDTRPRTNFIYRRRVCLSCSHRVTTSEHIHNEADHISVTAGFLKTVMNDIEKVVKNAKKQLEIKK